MPPIYKTNYESRLSMLKIYFFIKKLYILNVCYIEHGFLTGEKSLPEPIVTNPPSMPLCMNGIDQLLS